VKVEDIMICIESWWKMRGEREGVRESNGRGWMDQSKVYSERTHQETPLNIDLEMNKER
jgi:hypothetical protein